VDVFAVLLLVFAILEDVLVLFAEGPFDGDDAGAACCWAAWGDLKASILGGAERVAGCIGANENG